ncbi:hypothetical protein ED236_00510 [Pseudomethylobacillus aquaticus]|uniref:Uncharacterized protein n=1 Tax=Pseudomethylobacillus aquaticus TaxID=2676064 RepID=A0A3N0V5C4_9PROT|nr:hypothetical protein [Pseudomethylobacillus aquaticus]ROH88010.1 hypothetical protein ED236_00510 [Pseudomethylobacillus aquaticus]
MSILLPTRWRKQPQTPVEIDWSHPLAKGLTGMWVFNSQTPYNLVTGERASSPALSVPGANRHGKTLQPTDMVLAADMIKLLPAATGSVYFQATGSNESTGYTTYVFASVSGSINNSLAIHGFDSANGNYLYFSTGVGGTYRSVISNTSKLADAAMLFTYGGGSYKAYNAGKPDGTLSTSQNHPVGSGRQLLINSAPSGLVDGAKNFNVLCTWNRKLSDSEAKLLGSNPYQLLVSHANQRRYGLVVPGPIFLSADIVLPGYGIDSEVATGVMLDADLTLPVLEVDIQVRDDKLNGDIDLPMWLVEIDTFTTDFGEADLELPLLEIDGRIVPPGPPMTITATLPALTIQASLLFPMSGNITLPMIEITADTISGASITANIALPAIIMEAGLASESNILLPAITMSGAVLHGNALNANLAMPSITALMQVGVVGDAHIAATLPMLQMQSAGITGGTIAAEIGLPSLLAGISVAVEGLVSGNMQLPSLRAAGEVLSGSSLAASLLLPQITVSATVAHGAVMGASITLPILQMDAVMVGDVRVTANLILPRLVMDAFVQQQIARTFYTSALNLANAAAAEYENFPALAMGRVGDAYVMIAQDGVYLMDGDTDAGQPIDAIVKTGESDLGSSNLKRLQYAYVGARGTMDLAMHADGGHQSPFYSASHSGNGIATTRIKMGKGTKSRYWQAVLRNVDGEAFELDALELIEEVTGRRVS